MNNTTIIPVESFIVEPDVNPSQRETRLEDSAKNTALAQELAVLRSDMEHRVSQLQNLVEQEGNASETAQLLDQITAQMRDTLSLNDLLKTAVKEANTILKTDRVFLYQFTSNFKGKIVVESIACQCSSILNSEIVDLRLAYQTDSYRSGQVQAITNINNSQLDERLIEQLKSLNIQSCLIAPIYARNLNIRSEKTAEKQLYGLLIAQECSQPRTWNSTDIEFFRSVSQQLSYALDELLLFQQQQTLLWHAKRLNYIQDQLRRSSSVKQILITAVEETRETLKCDRVVVYEFRPEWDGRIIAESVGRQWPAAIDAEIDDPCFAERYVQPYQQGRVKAINDIYQAGLGECYLNQLEAFSVRANLVAPILVENKLRGLLVAHQCSGPRVWTELDIDMVRNVAIHLGYALDQASALEQQQATAQKAKVLNSITHQLLNSTKPEQVFDLLVDQVRQVFKTDQVLIYQYHQNGSGEVISESVANHLPKFLGKTIDNAAFSEADLKILQRKRVYPITDLDNCELNAQLSNFQPYQKLLDAKTHLIAPLVASTQLHGLLIINDANPKRVWENSELDFVKQLTAQVSLALDQLIARQQQEAVAQQERRLNQISAVIQDSLNLEEIFNIVVGETRVVLNADRAIIYQFDREWDSSATLTVNGKIVAESVDPKFPSALNSQLYDPGSNHDIKPYRQGYVTAIADIQQGTFSRDHLRQLANLNVKAKLVAPIIAKQRLHGLLIVHNCSETQDWKLHEINFVRQLAVYVGHAVNQTFLQQQQQATKQAKQINEICCHIRQTLNPKEICRTAVEELLELMSADRLVMYQPNQSKQSSVIAEAVRVRSGYLKISDFSTQIPHPKDEGLEKLAQGKEVLLSDLTDVELTTQYHQLRQWQVKTALMIPVFVNQTLYVIETHHCSEVHYWRESEIELFKQVGLQVGYALEQAQLLEEVQQSRTLAEQMMSEQQQQKQHLQAQIETFLTEIEDSFGGDLTVRAQVKEGVMGTVADFFNATLESLQQLVAQVEQSAKVVTITVAEREQDVENLSCETVQQTKAILAVVDQIHELTQSIEAVAASAQGAQTQVQIVAEILQKGDQAMNRTVEGILTLEKTIRMTARKVKNLGESSQKISRIVKLINEFASQTHVLALNASVEASRMNHTDSGFAMVANEVRTLAEQSGNATAEIEEMIGEIQTEIAEVMQAMKIGFKRVQQETEMVQKTRKTLTEIVQASNQTHEFVNQIAGSARHQTETSTQLSETMQQVAAIAHASSQQSVQVRQAFAQLMQVAAELQDGVSQFKVTQV
ncbi:MAG: GAF domain-containing protein [Cyanobacteria bacterium J06592_8]